MPINVTKPDTTLLTGNDKTTHINDSKFKFIVGIENLVQLDTIQLSADYYSNPYFENPKAQSCKTSVIGYKVLPISKNSFELPCAVKDYTNLEEPKENVNKNNIFYINPMPELKIISDPLSPKKAPVEEAPNGKLDHSYKKLKEKEVGVYSLFISQMVYRHFLYR